MQEYNQYSKKVSVADGKSLSYIDLLNDKDLENIDSRYDHEEIIDVDGTNLMIDLIDPYSNPHPTCIVHSHNSEIEFSAGEIQSSPD